MTSSLFCRSKNTHPGKWLSQTMVLPMAVSNSSRLWLRSTTDACVIQNAHAGKAAAVTSEWWRPLESGDYSQISINQLDFWRFPSCYHGQKQGFDVVDWSREMIGAKRDKEPWYRHLMGRGFNLFVQMFTKARNSDTQCGFKPFAKSDGRTFPKLYIYGKRARFKDAFTGYSMSSYFSRTQKRFWNSWSANSLASHAYRSCQSH